MSAPILAYVVDAALHCADCIGSMFGRRPGETVEQVLDSAAAARGIDRDSESDQDDFPVRTYDIEDCLDEEGRPNSCFSCLCPLGVQPY